LQKCQVSPTGRLRVGEASHSERHGALYHAVNVDPASPYVDYAKGRRIFYWRHARARMAMRTRGISEAEVESVLRQHDVDIPSEEDPEARALIGDAGGRRIRVVVRPHYRSVEVKTVMPVRAGRMRSPRS